MKSKLLPDSDEIQKTGTECFKNVYSKGQEDLEKMNRFLNAYNLPQFNLWDISM